MSRTSRVARQVLPWRYGTDRRPGTPSERLAVPSARQGRRDSGSHRARQARRPAGAAGRHPEHKRSTRRRWKARSGHQPDRASTVTAPRADCARRADQPGTARRRARGAAVIYLDSSALRKLVRSEDETVALCEWLELRLEQPVVTSELGRVEILRAERRVGGEVLAEARAVVGDLDSV